MCIKQRLKINFWLFGGIIIVLVLAIGGYIGGQGNPSIITNTYIESMQRQDYEGAFRAIDAQQFLLNGQRTTQAQFIREAQATDSYEGKITSVREINARTDIREDKRTVALIFSRGQKSYPVLLLLKITNSTFITTLFNNYPYRIVSVSRM